MMSKDGFNKPRFGRDAKAFLEELGHGDVKEVAQSFGIQIVSLSPLGGEKTAVRVLVSNPSGREELEFAVMNIHAEELALSVGEIDDDLLPELEYFAEVAKAYSSACSSFAFAPSSCSALKRKLLQKGFQRDVCEDAIECVKQQGFLNEDEIAVRRVQLLAEKHWGRARIVAKLHEEGFDSKAMAAASEQLCNMDFVKPCAELICKKYGRVPTDPHDRDLMFASLSRMGYSTSDIREAIKLLR